MSEPTTILSRWTDRLASFVGPYLLESPALRPLADQSAAILHGSTTFGIEDAFSDLDLWLFAPAESIHQAESLAGTRFLSFVLNDKPGHFNLEPIGESRHRLARCDLEFVAELRRAAVVHDPGNIAGALLAEARQSMREEVRRAWFEYHYVEMRGFHRNCDNPIERGDAIAVLQGLVPAVNHALRAAMVLDGVPYPYIKWLSRAAADTPTGRRVVPLVNDILDLLSADILRHPGPEKGHPLSDKLREIRAVLVQCARAGRIDEPWLDRWWEHLTQARDGVAGIQW